MQFRIATLFWATLVVAASLALAGAWGILPAVYWIVGLWWAARREGNRIPKRWHENRDLTALVVYFACVIFCAGVLSVPTIRSGPRPLSPASRCEMNLRLVSLAVRQYRDIHRSFPPAVTPDASGRPVHSWRALLLELLDRPDLARRYDLKQPWDSPANAVVTAVPLPLLQCPSNDSIQTTPCATSYLAVVGPGTVWDAPAKPGVVDTRIMVVDDAQSGVDWAEPKDLTAEELLAAFGRGQQDAPIVRGPHPKSFLVALADGTEEWIPLSAPRAFVETMLYQGLTPQAKEELRELQEMEYERHRTDPMRHIEWRLLAWVASVVAFGVHAFRLRRGPPLSLTDSDVPDAAPSADSKSSTNPAAPPA